MTHLRSYLSFILFIALLTIPHEGQSQCAGAQSFSITPAFPATGDCTPGQVYQFCYTMVGYNQNGANGGDGNYEYYQRPNITDDIAFAMIVQPNGGGENDFFKTETEGLFRDTFEMTIINRWGNEVFHTANKDFASDGSYMNHEAEVGGNVSGSHLSTYRKNKKNTWDTSP